MTSSPSPKLAKTDFFAEQVPALMQKLIDDFNFVSVEDAAAVFGNAGHESNGFRSLQEIKPMVKGSRGGFGIMQWTGPRRRLYEAYCERNHLDPYAMGTNYAFLWVELKGEEGQNGRVLSAVHHVDGLRAKTDVFMRNFLRPGIPHLDSRVVWATRAYKAYKQAKGL